MDIRLICMDLDGTALQKDRMTFSPRLEAALENAHRQGIAVAVVTGRQFGLLPPAVKQDPVWSGLAVLNNGGQVRCLATGELLDSLDLDPEALRQLLKLAEIYDLPIEFSIDSKLYLTERSWILQQDDPGLTFHRDVILKNHGSVVETLEPFCERKIEKVNLLCIPRENRNAVATQMRQIAVSAVWSSGNCMEITHPQADKGRGLEKICALLGIPEHCAMALGDSGNDIAMLRRAGLGVAMGNAPDFVKDAADVLTDRFDEDGAAKAIERWALK